MPRPEADKLGLKVGRYKIGYLPFGGQVVRHSPDFSPSSHKLRLGSIRRRASFMGSLG
jgi:hypothetical protein